MGVFFILLLVPMMVQHFAVKGYFIDYEKKNKRAIAFFFIFLTVLIMFRHESVGNDTSNYMYYFQYYSKLNWIQLGRIQGEYGYVYFNKIVSMLSKDPRVFLAIAAIAVSGMIYPTYKRLCLDASLTIVLFSIMSTFVMMFSGIRQMLAIGLGVIAYEFTRRKKLVPFVLCVCIAFSIHTSAFMLAFMYPLYHARITKKWLIVAAPAVVGVFVFNRPIFTFLAGIMERYTKYDGEIASTGAYTILILFAIFTVFAFLIPDESIMDDEAIGLRNFMLMALVLQMFAPLHALAMRMNYYYIIFIPLLLPKIIVCRSDRWNRVALLGRHVMVVFFLAYFFISASTTGALHVFPYHFFWESV